MTEISKNRRVLFICYAFPPVGGAGVQRSVKFVKYLEDCGWMPTVLTVENPSVPVLDHDLVQDIPATTKILRARTLEPSYRAKQGFVSSSTSRPSFWKQKLRSWITPWLQPDLQILWNQAAFRLACRELSSTTYSAIYVSGPPFSSFLLGCRLKQRFKLPLVLDFRDEWSLSAKYLEHQSHKDSMLARQLALFEKTIGQADAIVATTKASARELESCCSRIGHTTTVHCIYNGFDPSDFELLATANDQVTSRSSSNFRLIYTGTLWKLTSVEPLVVALEQLSRNRPDLADRLELELVGRRTPEQDEILNRLHRTRIRLQTYDYLPHRESLLRARGADALLLLLANEPGAERVVPAKTFEYLALDRTILGLVPLGETMEILRRSRRATALAPEGIGAIEGWIADAIARKMQDGAMLEGTILSGTNSTQSDELRWCNRRELTQQLAEVLNRVSA